MQKIQSFISLIYLFLLTLRHTMKANVHIPNKQTACVSFSEQADVKSTPSEVGSPILCGKTFEKEGKKCAENLEVSDFLLNTHTHTEQAYYNGYACACNIPHNSHLQSFSANRKQFLFADFRVSYSSFVEPRPCHPVSGIIPIAL